MSRVVVIGGGAWGRALAVQARRAGAQVVLWARDVGRVGAVDGVEVVAGLPEMGAEAVLVAVPTQHVRGVMGSFVPGGPLVIGAKGLEARSFMLPAELLQAVHPGVPSVVLTGPTFASEVAAGLPAAAVVAGRDAGLRGRVIGLLATPKFRLYGNDDVVGAQLGGAAKNVIAIAAGVVIGAGLGENARAALVTRGLAEITRLAVSLGGRAETVAGLSGMGDLLLTCTGRASRNFRFGMALGAGRGVEAALLEAGGVVEGVATASALVARAAPLELPICASVAALVAGRVTVEGAAASLLARELRDE